MDSVQCNAQTTIAQLQNPGDFVIVQPQPAIAPSVHQLWVVLPGGEIYKTGIRQGEAGVRSWNGSEAQPILYSAIQTALWRGWMQWVANVSWLVANP